jgi:hypothetical protein
MWCLWFFTCVHNCASIYGLSNKNVENVKMNFYGQPNMFFCTIAHGSMHGGRNSKPNIHINN